MKSTDPDFTVGKHYRLWEFTTSQTATRHGIDNEPTNEIVIRLKRLCVCILDPAREALGPIRISSGYRSPRLNKAVGGSETSEHMMGMAADLIPLEASKPELFEWIKRNCQFNQLINEYNFSWVHVSYREGKNKKQVFKIP